MWMQIILIVFGVILGSIGTVVTTRYLDTEKSKVKPKLWFESKDPIRLQWGWSKKDSCFYCFTNTNVWYQNQSALGKTIKRIKFKSSTHDQSVSFSVRLYGGMPSIEPNSAPVQISMDIDCRSTVKKREDLPAGNGSMNIEIEGADNVIDCMTLLYEFSVPDGIKGSDDLRLYGER